MMKIQVQKKLHGERFNFELKVELSFALGTCTAICGESGAGKTTLLRMISGLTLPEKGIIKFGDEIYFDSVQKINISPAQRNIGFVFQDYALFPNMTVIENLKYALPSQADERVLDDMLEFFNITGLRSKRPFEISGGQKQRVAIARALVRRPRVLLLDEPLTALDPTTRETLQDNLKELIIAQKLTTLLVSHDANEIQKLAHKVHTL